jgi:hypothetical protein
MTISYILCSFVTFFPFFGIMHQEKSGNPAARVCSVLGPLYLIVAPKIYNYIESGVMEIRRK